MHKTVSFSKTSSLSLLIAFEQLTGISPTPILRDQKKKNLQKQSTSLTIYLFCGIRAILTSFQIDAAGDRQTPFAEVAQEAAEGSVVAWQCIRMQVV